MTHTRTFLATLSLAALLLVVACSEDRSAVKALQNDTERIHDESMKEMAEMMDASRSLKALLADSTLARADRDSLLIGRSATLEANAEMMKWMRDYHEPDEKMPKEEALKYLTEQKAAIEANQASIRKATLRCKALLERYKK